MSMTPRNIKYRGAEKLLELRYADGETAELPAEYLRVFSPSAEVRGHSADQAVLQTGKKHVAIERIEPIGNYAVKIVFDDGHDTGIYSWEYLWELHSDKGKNLADYEANIKSANASRLPTIQVGQWQPNSKDPG